MSAIPHLSDFTKPVSDLLTRGFPAVKKDDDGEYVESSQGVGFALKPRSGLSVKSGVTSKAGRKASTDGKVEAELDVSDIGAKLSTEYQTKGVLNVYAKFADKLPAGLSAKVGLKADAKSQYAHVGASFEHEHFHVHGHVDVPVGVPLLDFVQADQLDKNQLNGGVHLVSGLPQYKVFAGVEAACHKGESDFEFDSFGVTGLFKEGDFQVSLGFAQAFAAAAAEGKAQDPDTRTVEASFASKIGAADVVGQVEHNVEDSDTVLTLGTGYPLNPDARVSARLDTRQRVGFAYAHQLSANTKLSFGTLVSAARADGAWNLKSDYAFKLDISQ